MANLLHLCLPWTMWIAFALVTVIALWDLLYGGQKFTVLQYPKNAKIRQLSYIFCILIFILWQITPGANWLEENVSVMIIRLVFLIVYYFIARVFLYLVFLGFMYYLHWSIFGKLP